MIGRRVGLLSGMLLWGALWLAVLPSAANPPTPPTATESAPFAKGPPIAPDAVAAPDPAHGVALNEEEQAALEQMTDIRDIRPPVAYGWDPRWGVGGVLAAVFAGAVGLLWWLRGRRRGPQPVVSQEPAVSPEEVAREELAALAREAGLGDKEFYFRLCTAVRRFLDGRYGAETLECTTEELLPVLRGLPLDEDARGALVNLFRDSAPIRYADDRAPGERRRADLAAAQDLVRSPIAGADPAGEGG